MMTFPLNFNPANQTLRRKVQRGVDLMRAMLAPRSLHFNKKRLLILEDRIIGVAAVNGGFLV